MRKAVTTEGRDRQPYDIATLQAFVLHSFERHAITLADWISRTSNARARLRGHHGLRPSHDRVFVHLSLSGSRVIDIARAEGVSKNAIGQTVSELERLGYVERRADHEDGRAKRIHYTEKGLRLLFDAREIGDEINADLAAAMGERKFAQLRRLLAEAVTAAQTLNGPELG